jgi:hypothetical protein
VAAVEPAQDGAEREPQLLGVAAHPVTNGSRPTRPTSSRSWRTCAR